MELIFDTEANGLLKEVDTLWMVCATDINTGINYDFCDYDSSCFPLKEFKDLFMEATMLSGHFILGYDFPMLEKVMGFKLPKHIKKRDTMLMSQVLDYNRFFDGFKSPHNIERWGEFFGIPKPEHEDWTKYSPEMLYRCRQDRAINVKVYQKLMQELKATAARNPAILTSLYNEHRTLEFVTEAAVRGWDFDSELATKTLVDIRTSMLDIEQFIIPLLDHKVKNVDGKDANGEQNYKEPKWIKNGCYNAHTSNWFNLPQEAGLEEYPPICGPYTRIEFIQPDMGSIESVKGLLEALGWIPDDWTWKKDPITNQLVKVSAKLTTTSLLPLGEIGKMIDEYYTLRSRHSMVEGFLNGMVDGKVHGECFTIATPTGRARHKNIVNIPGGDESVVFGKEIRQMFLAPKGYKMIGADSSGNQMRASMAYVKLCEFGEGLTANTERSLN